MKNLVLVVIGIALLAFGGYRQFAGSGVSAADQARCEQLVREQNGDSAEALELLLPKCNDPGMVAMIDSRAAGDDAQSAANRIASANQGEVGGGMVNWVLIGAGLAALAAAASLRRRRA